MKTLLIYNAIEYPLKYSILEGDYSDYKGTNDGGEWNTYEETLEAGIKECLKLI